MPWLISDAHGGDFLLVCTTKNGGLLGAWWTSQQGLNSVRLEGQPAEFSWCPMGFFVGPRGCFLVWWGCRAGPSLTLSYLLRLLRLLLPHPCPPSREATLFTTLTSTRPLNEVGLECLIYLLLAVPHENLRSIVRMGG